jgi:hypothetical protein
MPNLFNAQAGLKSNQDQGYNGGFYKRGCQEETLHLIRLGKIFF